MNPLATLPLGDLLRDLSALVLLFGALSLPWDGSEDGSGRWWVVIAVIVSAASLATPYVVAARIVPGWTGAQVTLVKLAAAAPLVVSALAALINELVHVNDVFDGYLSFLPGVTGGLFGLEGGIGAGVGVALAGALFAAQPRAIEDVPGSPAASLWRPAALGLLAVGTALLVVTTLVQFGTSVGDEADVNTLIGILVVAHVGIIVAIALPLPAVLDRNLEWARVLGAAGAVLIAVQFLGSAADDPLFLGFVLEKLKTGAGVFLLAGGIAALLARPVLAGLTRIDPVTSWVRTASNACVLLAALLGLSAAGRILAMIGDDVDAVEIIQVVVMVFAAAAAVAARSLLAGNADQARPAVVGILGGILLAAIVAIAVGQSAAGGDYVFTGEAVAWFGMSGLALWSLLIPAPIRESFRPLAGHGQQPPVA